MIFNKTVNGPRTFLPYLPGKRPMLVAKPLIPFISRDKAQHAQAFGTQAHRLARLGAYAGRAQKHPFPYKKKRLRRKGAAAIPAGGKIGQIPLAGRKTEPEKKRKHRRNLICPLQMLQKPGKERKCRTSPVCFHPKGKQEFRAVVRKSKSGPVCSQAGNARHEHPFLKGQIPCPTRIADAKKHPVK
jgi:hypothetical protein